MRLTLLAPCALLIAILPGCYEFTGELDKLGFTSNLALGSLGSWNPDHGIAQGTAARFSATQLLDSDDGEPPNVSAVAKGRLDVLASEGRDIVVTGRGGTIRYDGQTTDLFRVDFRPIDEVVLQDGFALLAGLDEVLPQHFAMVVDVPMPVTASMVDRRGEPLGWATDQLEVFMEPMGSTHDDESILVPLEVGEGSILAGYAGNDWEPHRVRVIEVDEIASVELQVDMLPDAAGWLVRARAWTEDGLVVWAPPVTWNLPGDGDEPLVGRGHGAVVEDGDVGLVEAWIAGTAVSVDLQDLVEEGRS